jgi:hypothetical protein
MSINYNLYLVTDLRMVDIADIVFKDIQTSDVKLHASMNHLEIVGVGFVATFLNVTEPERSIIKRNYNISPKLEIQFDLTESEYRAIAKTTVFEITIKCLKKLQGDFLLMFQRLDRVILMRRSEELILNRIGDTYWSEEILSKFDMPYHIQEFDV